MGEVDGGQAGGIGHEPASLRRAELAEQEIIDATRRRNNILGLSGERRSLGPGPPPLYVSPVGAYARETVKLPLLSASRRGQTRR